MGQPERFRMPLQPLNAGRMTGAKAPLKPKDIWAIRQHLKSTGSGRDLAMFNTALDAKLMGSDLFKPRLADVAQGGGLCQRSTFVQQKTGRPVPFQITEPAREALAVKSHPGAQPALALDEHDRACFIFSRSPTILPA